MGRVGKVDFCVVTVSDEERPLPKLGSAIVDGVYLETIHVIRGPWDTLEVVGKSAHDGAGVLIVA
jgi:hypothetical protein